SRCVSANAPGDSAFAMSTACRRGHLGAILTSSLFPERRPRRRPRCSALPCSFLRGPFGLGLGVAGDPADSLLDGALYLTSGARDAIFVHGILWVCATTNSGRGRRFIRPQITTTQVGARLPLRRRDRISWLTVAKALSTVSAWRHSLRR